ncbi:hypothetical protein ACFL51_00375 [Myxococcota bacterium]
MPYSATFSFGNPDSVGKSADDLRRWWGMLEQWEGPEPGAPRSIQHLVETQKSDVFLLVTSPPYLTAVVADATVAAAQVPLDRFFVISTGGYRSFQGRLRANFLPCDARLQHVLGGAKQSLNARVAGWVLQNFHLGDVSHEEVVKRLETLLVEQPDLVRYERTPMTDGEVREFIGKQLRATPDTSASRLLRSLRDDGFACEQKRFHELFRAEKEVLYA